MPHAAQEQTATVAVVGNPNCGKSALFNALTGLRQKVANYPGATVDRRTGILHGYPNIELIDLPGTYSLTARSPDELITSEILRGERVGESKPQAIIAVVDATNLSQHLRFVLELQSLGTPMVLVLNMTDLAAREKITIDVKALSDRLGVPVIETIAVRRKGLEGLVHTVNRLIKGITPIAEPSLDTVSARQIAARELAKSVTLSEGIGHKTTRILDGLLLHSVAGPVILLTLLFLMFQAVFAWAETPMDIIDSAFIGMQNIVATNLSDGLLRSFINDGLLTGVGSVVIFLPQILILFAFILVFESTGYMARAAFLMDRLMASVGLNGRAFIPLLSSFACAIPGMMAARTIADPKDRLTTILIAPLMTCSARLPVYTLIIAAFIPSTNVMGATVGLQGLVMFILYIIGIISALLVAYVLKRTSLQGENQPFLMELPKYQMPNIRIIFTGLLERAKIFLRRAGTIILYSMMILWVLGTFPYPPEGATGPAIHYSFIGKIGTVLEYIFAPIGFNWEISVALVPGMAAREVAVGALGTVYALSGSEDLVAGSLVAILGSAWSLPTALAFLAWFVFAPQCLSTIAVARRETNSLNWTVFMVAYLFALAYIAAGLTFHISTALMGSN